MSGAAGRGARRRASRRWPGSGHPLRQGPAGGGVVLQEAPQQQEGLPVALLQGGGLVPASATASLAAGEARGAGPEQRLHGGPELGTAQLVARPVGLAPLEAVLPALGGAVDDGRGLAVAHRQGAVLGGEDQREVESVGDLDHIPVVQVEELARVPLHVVAGLVPVAGDGVGVDGGLVPVEVDDGVVQAGGAGEGGGFGHPARGEAALTLDDVHPGGSRRRSSRPPPWPGPGRRRTPLRRRPWPASRRASPGWDGRRGPSTPKRRKRGVDWVGLRRKPSRSSKRRRSRSSAGRAAGVAEAHHLVAQGQHGVEAQRLVAGGIGEQVGIAAVGVADVVVHGGEAGRRPRSGPRTPSRPDGPIGRS